ncbi:MAG: TadE/TadG family type IV pilus assembly protein [Candidatus Acidiferrales bacterium]
MSERPGTVAPILNSSRRQNCRGSAFVEFALTFPMLLFLLLGAFDLGFYCYALITVQDAARMVALYASSEIGDGDYSGACQYLLSNLSKLPNAPTSCSKILTITSVTDASGNPTGPDGNPAVSVTVSYQTIQLIPFLGIPGKLTINRTVEARRRS